MAIKKKSIFKGALILAAASIITRLLGFVYRIFMSNAIGAEGMGLYQLIMPLYTLAWSIACSGISTTISKLVAQENAKGEYGNMGRIMKQCLVITCSIACVLTFSAYFGAEIIAINFLHDERTMMPLQILAFAFPFMAAGSVIRGYFLGLQQSEIPAISQILEQCVRMAVIYMLAGAFMSRGLVYACIAAVIGIVAEEMVSFLYMLYSYRKFKLKHSLVTKPTYSSIQSIIMIVSMALPLTANRVIGSFLSTIESTLIPQRLQMFGLSSTEAISMLGQISGMAMPLIFFPSAFLTALSVTLVPAVSEAVATNNKERISSTISKSFLFTMLLGIGASGIFLVLPNELGMVIYNQDIGDMLFMLGLMCPFWYLNITISGILNGLAQQTFIFRINLISSFINIACILLLVPRLGINGFILGWFLSLLFISVLSVLKIRKVAKIEINIANWFLKPAIASAATSMTIEYISRHFIFPLFGGAIGLIVSILCIVSLYCFFILLLGCIKLKDITTLFSERFGSKRNIPDKLEHQVD